MLTKYQKSRVKRAIKLIETDVHEFTCSAICRFAEYSDQAAYRTRLQYSCFYGFASSSFWPGLGIRDGNDTTKLQRELMLELFLQLNGDLNG